jgi:hypothetical protein
MIHTPYNTTAYTTDLSDETIGNKYPCLKHLWHQDDVTGGVTTSWVDRIGGCSFTPDTGTPTFSKDGTGVSWRANTGDGTYAGTLSNPSGKHCILFAQVGILTTSDQRIVFYDIDSVGAQGFMQLCFKESKNDIYMGPNQDTYLTITTAATAVSAERAFGMSYCNFSDSALAGSAYYRKTASQGLLTNTIGSGIALTAGGTGDAEFTNLNEIKPGSIAAANAHKYTSFGILIFENVGSTFSLQLKAAADWMYENPGHIYPGFYGLS